METRTNVNQGLAYLEDRLKLVVSRKSYLEGKSTGVVRKLNRKIRNLSK